MIFNELNTVLVSNSLSFEISEILAKHDILLYI